MKLVLAFAHAKQHKNLPTKNQYAIAHYQWDDLVYVWKDDKLYPLTHPNGIQMTLHPRIILQTICFSWKDQSTKRQTDITSKGVSGFIVDHKFNDWTLVIITKDYKFVIRSFEH